MNPNLPPEDNQAPLFVNEDQDQYSAKTDDGCILLSRSFFESSLFMQKEPVMRLGLYLIGRANWQPKKWYCSYQKREMIIDRGQIVTSLTSLTERLPMLSRKQLRLALKKLLISGFVRDDTPTVVKRANGYYLLTVVKYGIYQDLENYKGQRRANEGPTKGQRRDTTKEGNKGIREEEFYNSVNSKRVSKRIYSTVVESWEPKNNHVETAKNRRIDLDFQVRKFKNYAKNRKDPYKDLDAAFDNWLLSDYQNKPQTKEDRTILAMQALLEEKQRG